MKRKIKIILFSFCVLLLAACGKGGSTAGENGSGSGGGGHVFTGGDTTAPVLEIYTPVANQVFYNAGTINVTGKITDDYGLFRGSVRITRDSDGYLLKEQLYEVHGLLSYNFSVGYVAFENTAVDYTVTVNFEDHGLNSATKTVKIRVIP